MKGKFQIGSFVSMPTSDNESNNKNKVLINIHDIKNNPMNFYRVKDIEAMAKRLTFAPDMDRISVFEDGDKYMLCSGHKRVAALLYGLKKGYEFSSEIIKGDMIEVTLKDFEKEERDLGKGIFTKEDFQILDLILPNKGQRRNLSVAEEATEIEYLEPVLRKEYDYKKSQGELAGVKWRTYFADLMEMSETRLQRFIDYRKLSPEVKAGIEKGFLKFTVVVDELANLSEGDQKDIFSNLQAKQNAGEEITGKSVKAEKKAKIEQRTPKKESPLKPDTNNKNENLAQLEAEGQIVLPGANSEDIEVVPLSKTPEDFGRLAILLSKKENGYIAGFRFEYMDQVVNELPNPDDIAEPEKEKVIQDQIIFMEEFGSYKIKVALYEGGYIKTAPEQPKPSVIPEFQTELPSQLPVEAENNENDNTENIDTLKLEIYSFIDRIEVVTEKEKMKQELEAFQIFINKKIAEL